MRAVIQRVAHASVRVEGTVVASIERGFLVLLGVHRDDSETEAAKLATKVASLRLFEDGAGKMNLDPIEAGAEVLCVSQFTLFGDVRRGRRPSFEAAAPPEQARELYEAFCAAIEAAGLPCERGVFGANMEVELVNDGPVTLVLDTADLERPRRA